VIPELDPGAFVEFLSALWDEKGWETSVRERADETYFVTGKRPGGKRGAIYVFPTTTSTVTERHVRKFVQFCTKKGIDVAVVATQGAFAEGAERAASERGVHLLDRSTLADTIEEGGLEAVLARFTGGDGPLDRLRELGIPIPESVGGRVPSPAVLGALVYGVLPVGGGNAAAQTGSGGSGRSGGSSSADKPAPASPSPDGLGIVAGCRKYATQPVPAALLVIALLVAFALGAAVGPAVGLGGGLLGGGSLDGGGDAGPDVSAVSTAGGANATADVRWNARATDSLTANGTTYDAPSGQTFLLVRMNVTHGGDEPMQFEQSALAADVAGTRYSHQPLNGVTGFPSAGLFAPGDTRAVWTVFAVPEDAGSVTIVLDGEAKVRFVHDDGVTPEATVDGS
jgi:hypothetical protein